MARRLRWAALAAILSLPLIMYLGRPVTEGCPPDPIHPCDPQTVSPGWTLPAIFLALAIGALLRLLAAGADHKPEEDKP